MHGGGGDHDDQTPTAGKEKSILIHVSRVKDPAAEEQTLEDMELKLKSEWKSRDRHSSYRTPAQTNSWYILEHTPDGPKISEIFVDLPQVQEDRWLDKTSCAIVGSSLYVIGGNIIPTSSYSYNRLMSNLLHRLDLNNPADGWKTSSIPFRSAGASAKVIGNSICLLSRIERGSEVERPYNLRNRTDHDVGLVYDTIEQVAYTFKPPSGCTGGFYYLPLEGRGLGLVFPVTERETEQKRVYIHDPSRNSWEQLHDYSGLTRATCSFSTCAVSNGILYSVDVISKGERTTVTTLSAYDLNNGNKLFRKMLPSSYQGNMWLVSVSDLQLCLLDHRGGGQLHYAKISVSLDPPTLRIIEERCLPFDAFSVVNCLPFSASDYSCRNKEIFDATRNKNNVLELYWKRCCRHLMEENLRLQDEVNPEPSYMQYRAYDQATELQSNTQKMRQITEIKKVEPKPMLTKEKSILIHVSRVADPTEARGCEEMKVQFHQLKMASFFDCKKEQPNIPKTDSWFMITHTTAGPQISEIFHNVPQGYPNNFCKGSISAIVGSSLYVIGGRYSFSTSGNYFSNEIRRLDLQNTAKGWETNKLPYCFSDGRAEVADNFIYLLPSKHFCVFKDLEAEHIEKCYSWEWGIGCDSSGYPWGLVYDTIKHEATPLKLPEGNRFKQEAFGFHLKGRGVLVAPEKHYDEPDEFYIHDPSQNSWELLDSYFDLRPNMCGVNYVVSNGILFLFGYLSGMERTLLAYDCNASSAYFLDLLFEIKLPPFNCLNSLRHHSIRVVAVADLTFCILAHEDNGSFNKGPLYYAKVSVSLDPSPSASILEETCFHMEATEVLNCLPFDSDLSPNLFEEISVLGQQNDEILLATSSKPEAQATEEEQYWKQCFKKLMEDNRKLQKEMQELKVRQHLSRASDSYDYYEENNCDDWE